MKPVLGVIFGSRSFFPVELVNEARQEILSTLSELKIDSIMLKEDETRFGCVETYEHAKACAELFKVNRDTIDGILVVLPNFGDESSIANTIKLSGLNVPILVQAYPDDLNAFNVERRRDAFCGKISVCNNLKQYGYDFTLTSMHTCSPRSELFKKDLIDFIGVCRVVKGLRSVRLGAIGARPGDFNTVRYSEKLLQSSGISVITADLSEIIGSANRLMDTSPSVKAKLDEIHAYAKHGSVPSTSMMRMAKLGAAITDWMIANEIQATALQCWNSLQKNYGVNACTLMSMMSDQFMPSACETDITGVVSMYALQLASGNPAGLVDWNNNYVDDPDKCVLFHCGNLAKSFFPEIEIKTADILGTTLGPENTYGALNGRVKSGPMTYARISTDDLNGKIKAYTGEGELTDDPLDTFGSRAVVTIPGLQDLLKYICNNGFEHHVAITTNRVSSILSESLSNYLHWDLYKHGI